MEKSSDDYEEDYRANIGEGSSDRFLKQEAEKLAFRMAVSYFYDHYISPETYNNATSEQRILLEIGPVYRSELNLNIYDLQEEIAVILSRIDVLLPDYSSDRAVGSFTIQSTTIEEIIKSFINDHIPPGAAMPHVISSFKNKLLNHTTLSHFLKACHGFDLIRLWLRPPAGALYIVPEKIIIEILLSWLFRTGYITTLLASDVEYLKESRLGETLHFLSLHPKLLASDKEMCKTIIEKYWNVLSSAENDEINLKRVRIQGERSVNTSMKMRRSTGSARREARSKNISKRTK